MTEHSNTEEPQRFENLVVVRESAMYDHLLMEGMIDQTLQKALQVPGAEMMKRRGIDPVHNPRRYNGRLIPRRNTKAVLLEERGTLFLYSEGSAAKVDDKEGTNAFVELLSEVIETYQPRHLWVSVFSRLVRAAEHGGRLLGVVSKYIDVVHAETDMDLSTDQGRLLWQMYSMFADVERTSIVNRLIIGRIFWWRRGQWLLPSAVPFGYHLVDGELQINPDEVDATKAMIEMLADHNLTAPQICAALGKMGASTAQLRALHGDDATFADARHPYSAVATLRNWLGLYQTGTYRYRETIPFKASGDIVGIPVQKDEDGKQFIELTLTAPTPEGGWVPDELFEMARTRPTRSGRNRGGKGHQVSKPFVNHFHHDDDTYEHTIRARQGRYLLYRRPSGDPERSWYKGGNKIDAELIGSIDSKSLHISIATGVAEAIRTGVPAELLGDEFFWSAGDNRLPRIQSKQQLIDGVTRRLTETRHLESQARRRAIEAGDDLAEAFINDAQGLRDEARRLEARLTELESESDTPPELEDQWDSNAAAVAAALGKLGQVTDTAPAELRSAIDAIFCDSALRPAEEGLAEWSCCVLLPTQKGAVKLGPIKGTVPLRQRQERPSRLETPLSQKAEAILQGHPDQETLATALAGDLSSEDPYLRHLATTYSDEMKWWPNNQWKLADCGRQGLVDALMDLGGEATTQELIEVGVDRNHLHRFSKPAERPFDHPVADRIGTWKKGPTSKNRTVRLKPCPHCAEPLTVVIRVPEVDGGLLCKGCRRSSAPNSPQFPLSYLPPEVSLDA